MNIPFAKIDWTEIIKSENRGLSGTSLQQVIQYPGLRIRIVEYSSGYMSDHWCQNGHIVHCLEGSFESELENGEKYEIEEGMSYIVSDGMSSHRSSTVNGVKLMIIDGDFMK